MNHTLIKLINQPFNQKCQQLNSSQKYVDLLAATIMYSLAADKDRLHSLHLVQFIHTLNLINATLATLHAVTLMSRKSHRVKAEIRLTTAK